MMAATVQYHPKMKVQAEVEEEVEMTMVATVVGVTMTKDVGREVRKVVVEVVATIMEEVAEEVMMNRVTLRPRRRLMTNLIQIATNQFHRPDLVVVVVGVRQMR